MKSTTESDVRTSPTSNAGVPNSDAQVRPGEEVENIVNSSSTQDNDAVSGHTLSTLKQRNSQQLLSRYTKYQRGVLGEHEEALIAKVASALNYPLDKSAKIAVLEHIIKDEFSSIVEELRDV